MRLSLDFGPTMNPTKLAAGEFREQLLDAALERDVRHLVRLALLEDLDRATDLTTMALVPSASEGKANIITRQAGVAAGFDLVSIMLDEMDCDIEANVEIKDGASFQPRQRLAQLRGSTRDLLTCERTLLNFLGRLCGIASLAQRFCQAIQGTEARIYDTRKTTPGWRRLEKYATRCGGAFNHRHGLYDAILIKDNHLACRAAATGEVLNPRQAVAEARQFLAANPYSQQHECWVEVEVDSLHLLELALTHSHTDAGDGMPDIVLLDNMTTDMLRQGVLLRDRLAPNVILEASGGVRLDTVAAIAATGVDRISVGALTHSAVNLDLGLDWDLAADSSKT